MIEAGIGRLLIASLHQAISDILPTRLEFYEEWLKPAGLREGRIGLAQLAAVLSFLRQEGAPYDLITALAGEYTAEWTVAGLPGLRRRMIAAAPSGVRIWLVMRLARRLVRQTYTGSRAVVRWRGGAGAVDIRGSIFCKVRDRVPQPLCAFYAAAIRRLTALFTIDTEVEILMCQATGEGECRMTIAIRAVEAGVAA